MPWRRPLFPLLLAVLHLYIGARVVPDLPAIGALRPITVLLLAFCYGLMLLTLLARSLWRRPLADRIATPGLFMAGLFSSLLVLTLVRDVVLLPLSFALSASKVLTAAAISATLVVVLGILITLVGFISARRRARIVDVSVPIANLPAALHGFSIAQVSDVHVGATIRRDYVARIVEAVNALEADVIALTGDFVDGPVHELAPHTAPLARLRARYGAFFVTGNHEYYSGEPVPGLRSFAGSA